MEKALIEKGVAAPLAKALAKKACEPALQAVPGLAKAGFRKSRQIKRKADRKLSAALKEANRRLRTKSGKLRKGYKQADIMRLAQKLRKKM